MKFYSSKILVPFLVNYLLGMPLIVFSNSIPENNYINLKSTYSSIHVYTKKPQRFISDTDSSYYFLSNKEIKEKGIKYIKVFNSTRDDTAFYKGRGFEKYDFLDGRLITELSFDQAKTNLEEARDVEYHYYYTKSASGKYLLKTRVGDAYNSYSHEDHILNYIYKKDRLFKTEYRTISTLGKREVTGREIDYFYYHPNGLIDSIINIDDGQHTRTYQYFIYYNNQILAYFPAKVSENQGITQSDLIYFKTNEISKLGFNAYRARYLGGENSKKIIDDCYTAVNSKDVIIDGLNINQYLLKNKNKLVKYMVIEVSDNYFLFLKIN